MNLRLNIDNMTCIQEKVELNHIYVAAGQLNLNLIISATLAAGQLDLHT